MQPLHDKVVACALLTSRNMHVSSAPPSGAGRSLFKQIQQQHRTGWKDKHVRMQMSIMLILCSKAGLQQGSAGSCAPTPRAL
mmetsp:Transcript_36772/g.81782  ORF Transcript_36772/g.81782 Transcript_36772/m.81782 type:complete len:82 (+) Transcript_36772:301-546(+)